MAKSPFDKSPTPVPPPTETPAVTAEDISIRDVRMKAIEVGLHAIVTSSAVSIAGISNKHQYVRACVHQVFVLADIVADEYRKLNS
jgi:hypothetical protein